MKTTMPMQQRGISFGGFIFASFLVVVFGITGLKLIPPYLQEAQIKNIFTTMSRDPDLQNASPHDIRMTFTKRASIDNITAIKAEDLDIVIDGGVLVLSASYYVKVPLAGNMSLFMEFNPRSAK